MINVGIHGSTGRVGRLLIDNLLKDKEAKPHVLHAIEDFGFTTPKDVTITDDVSALLQKSDVVIDFTISMGTETLLENALKHPTPLVIGTTGLASKSLSDFDIEIVEQHHRFKKDAPSGTALTLGEHAARGRGLNLDDVRVSGRNGLIGERTKDEIAIMALRGGDIVGRHTVGFYNDGEFIEMNHTATSRDTFAKGAIKAAKWIINQPNGLYTISDCLGL